MKKLFFIANWKSHKTPYETEEYFKEFSISSFNFAKDQDKEVIICPPFPLLDLCLILSQKYAPFVKIGTQDISQFPEGAYTGDVSGRLIKAYATYVIVGHSERREYFSESDDILSKKVLQVQANLLTPIFCVSNDQQKIPSGVSIIAYEPIDAIGTGNAQDPQIVEKIASSIKQKNTVSYILYGGSVAPQNVSTYTDLPSINGVLVGGASRDPLEFSEMIKNA